MDGELSSLIIAKNYPKAAVNSLPGLTPATDRLEMLATGKVDVTLMEAAIASEYMEANPGKIKQLTDTPVQVGGSVIIIPHNEHALKSMLNAAINAISYSGADDIIITKHEKYKGSFLLPAKQYRASE